MTDLVEMRGAPWLGQCRRVALVLSCANKVIMVKVTLRNLVAYPVGCHSCWTCEGAPLVSIAGGTPGAAIGERAIPVRMASALAKVEATSMP